MYRIMVRKGESIYYSFMTADDGTFVEIETKEALDTKVEEMLNDGGYAKSDFVVVKVIDYTVDAKEYSDDE